MLLSQFCSWQVQEMYILHLPSSSCPPEKYIQTVQQEMVKDIDTTYRVGGESGSGQ